MQRRNHTRRRAFLTVCFLAILSIGATLAFLQTKKSQNKTVADQLSVAVPTGYIGRDILYTASTHNRSVFQPVRAVQLSASPQIYYVRNIITLEEADAIIKEAEPRLQRSETVNKDPKLRVNTYRTSNGMFMISEFQMHLVEPIRQRVSKLTGIPPENFENMQILRYLPNEYYKPHPDFFSGEYAPLENIRGGNRRATIIMWLNNIDKDCGGTTSFPNVHLTVPPHKGDGVLFYSLDQNGNTNIGTFHSGDPVKDGCTKWVSVYWLRERRFR